MATVASGSATTHTVKGGGDLRLHVREWGRAAGPPILFIHGWSQNHLCWAGQYESALADEFRLVALDMRGHGMSEAPLEPEHYLDGRLWADDVAAILDYLQLERTVLVGWSYGAFVIGDYIRTYGQDRVAALNFTGGTDKFGPAALPFRGPDSRAHFAGATADDVPTNIATMRSFVRACLKQPISADDLETAVCWNVMVHPRVRANLCARELDYDDVLSALRVPLILSHGRCDSIVLPAMAEHILGTCPTAEASWYDDVGHAPHLEAPERFNRELAAIVARVRG